MAYELPADLIRQVKMATRAEAGLSDYDPTRDLPALPSLSEAVAEMHPSPPYLRCKNCKGRLLRGVQSVLCIYCGRSNDVPPEPISFKDTFAYRWLLDSLHLDGSEMVGRTTEKSELNRGQSTPKDEVPLSDFLNVKLIWPMELENKQILLNKETGKRGFLNLTGVDLDKFFSGSQTLNVSDTPEEHTVTSNHVEAERVKEAATHTDLSFFENVRPSKSAVYSSESKDCVEAAEAKEVASHNDFSFFHNVLPSGFAARSAKDKDGDAFSGWEANFQSADSGDQLDSSKALDPFMTSAVSSGNQHESSKPSDPLSGSTFDLSSQLDSVFGPGEALKDGNTQDGTAASLSTGDWNDDLWNSLSSKVSPQTGLSDSTVGVKDAATQDAQGNDSTSFDWLEVDQWQCNSVNAPSSNTAHGDDDPFIEWNDFTSSTSINISSENSAIQSHNQPIAASGETSEINIFSIDNKFEEMDFGSFSQADPFPSSSSKENVSAEMDGIGLEVSSSDRAADTEGDASRGSDGQPGRDGDGDVKTAGTEQKEDVEMILSQMHDLSFMLENKLSLPP